MTRQGLLLQQEVGSSFPGPSKMGPMPQPPFERTYMWTSCVDFIGTNSTSTHRGVQLLGRARERGEGDHRKGVKGGKKGGSGVKI